MKVVDPVCKMIIDSEKAAARGEYKGQTIYFCAKGCKSRFELAPEKYSGLGRDTRDGELQLISFAEALACQPHRSLSENLPFFRRQPTVAPVDLRSAIDVS